LCTALKKHAYQRGLELIPPLASGFRTHQIKIEVKAFNALKIQEPRGIVG
jgi:hypothetical protein